MEEIVDKRWAATADWSDVSGTVRERVECCAGTGKVHEPGTRKREVSGVLRKVGGGVKVHKARVPSRYLGRIAFPKKKVIGLQWLVHSRPRGVYYYCVSRNGLLGAQSARGA